MSQNNSFAGRGGGGGGGGDAPNNQVNNATSVVRVPGDAIVYIDDEGAEGVPTFSMIDLSGAAAPVALLSPTSPDGGFVTVRSGDADLHPARDQVAYTTDNGALGLLITDLPKGDSRALIDGDVPFSTFATPRYSTSGDTLFFVGGETNDGAFTSASIFSVDLTQGVAVTPQALSLSLGTCQVVRNPVVRDADRLVAIRDNCGVPTDAGVYEFLISTGNAQPIMRQLPNDTASVIFAPGIAADGTLLVYASGAFDLNLDAVADVSGQGIFSINLLNGGFIDLLSLDDDTQRFGGFTAAPLTGLVVEIVEGNTSDLFVVDFGVQEAISLTSNGRSRSPF